MSAGLAQPCSKIATALTGGPAAAVEVMQSFVRMDWLHMRPHVHLPAGDLQESVA